MGPLPDMGPAISIMLVLSVVGIIALGVGFGWLLWWAFNNISIVIGA